MNAGDLGSTMRPTILLLREGTDTSQGKGQLISNINACQAVAEAIRTTLGPRGMDKLISGNGKATISNDGAKLLSLLDIVHPAAKTLVDIARAQDSEIGDGTTTVTLLGAELLAQAKPFVEEGVAPQIINRVSPGLLAFSFSDLPFLVLSPHRFSPVLPSSLLPSSLFSPSLSFHSFQGIRKAALMAIQHIKALSIPAGSSPAARRALLERCAETSLNSKLIAGNKAFFAPMVVDAVECLAGPGASSSSTPAEDAAGAGGASLDLSLIGVKKVAGGSVLESFLVRGVAFKRTFSYAGFEQQPKRFEKPKILLLNLELELKSEKENVSDEDEQTKKQRSKATKQRSNEGRAGEQQLAPLALSFLFLVHSFLSACLLPLFCRPRFVSRTSRLISPSSTPSGL